MRRWLIAIAVVACLVAAWRFLDRPDAPGATAAPPSGSVRSWVAAAPDSLPPLVAQLGLSSPEDRDVQVLDTTEGDFLLLYPPGLDPVEVASRWSFALGAAGYRKRDDLSRPGRTVQRFTFEDDSFLLAVGRTTGGPFVSFSQPPDPTLHWATRPDAEAPPVLAPLLPPPPDPATAPPW